MTDKPRTMRGAMLIGLAAIAGILAGLGAIYARGGFSGNNQIAAAADCGDALKTAARIAPFAKGEVAAFQAAKDADDLSPIAFKAPDGSDVTLASFAGRTVLVNLWATWCVPCRVEMPALDRLEASTGSEQFAVVPINIDLRDPDRAKAFLTEIGVKALPFYSDPTTGVFQDMKKRGLAFGLPTTVLIDGKGCRIGSVSGPAEWDSEDAKALIRAAVGTG
jgi:thiol-disulfide isomerase/thioredoxin